MSQEKGSGIRILVVDDHSVFRDGLAAIINEQPGLTLIAQAETGEQAVECFRKHLPDVTLLDLRLPDINGIEVIRLIRESSPEARIIILTTYLADVQAFRAMKAGAAGYLLKATLRLDLIDAIRSVHAGGSRIPVEVASELARYLGNHSLTSREVEVLREVALGCSNKTVAKRLFISEETVKGHVSNILSKLEANDRTHAVAIALKRGFLET